MGKTLDQVVTAPILSTVWRKVIRRQIRTMRLPEFHLGHDPLEYLAFDWALDEIVNSLVDDVRRGTYRACSPEIVRGAKGAGLTRPLNYLCFRDILLYKAIVASAESGLRRGTSEWARMGRQDADQGDIRTPSGWFRAWLQRQGLIWAITSNCEWLVESDISNFYPSVDIRAVTAHIRLKAGFDDYLVRVLEHQLATFSPLVEYRSRAVGGLPIEGFDASRVLAHAYLEPLDHEFQAEGEDGRYTRWMDDVIVGTHSFEDALQVVRRFQVAVEKLGLYPNASKTRIYRSIDFRRDYYKDANDYLGDISQRQAAGEPVPVGRFRARLRQHLSAPRPRPRGWERVFRRFCTASRDLDDDYLLRKWKRHAEASPESAAHLLQYLLNYQLTQARFRSVVAWLESLGGVYEDVELLIQEYLSTAPNLENESLRRELADWAWGRLESAPTARLRASAIVTLGKFGLPSHLADLRAWFDAHRTMDTIDRQQALVVLLGTRLLAPHDLDGLAEFSGYESDIHIRFLKAIANGDKAAARMVLFLMEPRSRSKPPRSSIQPRLLFFAPYLAEHAADDYRPLMPKWRDCLAANPRRLRDRAAERWVSAPPSPIGPPATSSPPISA